jgi:hypothetical protein
MFPVILEMFLLCLFFKLKMEISTFLPNVELCRITLRYVLIIYTVATVRAPNPIIHEKDSVSDCVSF